MRHPFRKHAALGASLAKDEERVAAFGAAPEDRNDRPRARMEAVIDANFVVLIYGSVLWSPNSVPSRTWTTSTAPAAASSP
jgi:hypothetical protein